MKYSLIIGLETHVELKTKSKMFCACSADYFGKTPNTHTCPVCLGMPGGLPVPNKIAIEWCIKIALALNCEINLFSKFDRKNYFYPDLSKGYQISQFDLPFGKNGNITLQNGKTIGITRVHMEEDTGKLLHETIDGEKVSLIDFNRSGVPLVEIVTEPDFNNAQDVVEYLQKLQQIVRYLDVSDADMDKGDMRLEPNISLRKENEKTLPNYKVEVKNINSFKFVEKAISYEFTRQAEILDGGKTPSQETRGWNDKLNRTDSQRSKEEAHDYRYFPEPDIPPITFTSNQITELQKQIPELPDVKINRFIKDFNLSYYDAEILTREKIMANFFERAVDSGKKHQVLPKKIANMIINKKINPINVLPAELITIIVSTSQVTTVNETELEAIINEIIAKNEKAVNDYNNGKEPVIMFLVGQVMREFKTKIDAQRVKDTIKQMIKK